MRVLRSALGGLLLGALFLSGLTIACSTFGSGGAGGANGDAGGTSSGASETNDGSPQDGQASSSGANVGAGFCTPYASAIICDAFNGPTISTATWPVQLTSFSSALRIAQDPISESDSLQAVASATTDAASSFAFIATDIVGAQAGHIDLDVNLSQIEASVDAEVFAIIYNNGPAPSWTVSLAYSAASQQLMFLSYATTSGYDAASPSAGEPFVGIDPRMPVHVAVVIETYPGASNAQMTLTQGQDAGATVPKQDCSPSKSFRFRLGVVGTGSVADTLNVDNVLVQ